MVWRYVIETWIFLTLFPEDFLISSCTSSADFVFLHTRWTVPPLFAISRAMHLPTNPNMLFPIFVCHLLSSIKNNHTNATVSSCYHIRFSWTVYIKICCFEMLFGWFIPSSLIKITLKLLWLKFLISNNLLGIIFQPSCEPHHVSIKWHSWMKLFEWLWNDTWPERQFTCEAFHFK